MASVVKSAFKAIRERGLGTFIRELREEGYLSCLADGNLLQTKIHNIGATLVGVDKFGNKYYQKLGDTQYGISLKAQELYVIVFVTRYLDLFTKYISLYNTVMKLVFIGTSIAIVGYMRYHKVVKQTYNKDQDTFRHYFLILPCFVLALLFHPAFNVMQVQKISGHFHYILKQ